MYYIYIQKVFKKFYDEKEFIKTEIEDYFKRNFGEDIKLNYEIIEDYDGEFFGCVDKDNNIRFNLKFVNDGYRYLFDRIFEINPNSYEILEEIIEILLISILAHESHHFYYKTYRYEEYIEIKNKDNENEFRKDKELEVLADNFMVNFMKEKGDLHNMISGLSEKFNQMKNDNYTKEDRIDDIVKVVRNIYT